MDEMDLNSFPGISFLRKGTCLTHGARRSWSVSTARKTQTSRASYCSIRSISHPIPDDTFSQMLASYKATGPKSYKRIPQQVNCKEHSNIVSEDNPWVRREEYIADTVPILPVQLIRETVFDRSEPEPEDVLPENEHTAITFEDHYDQVNDLIPGDKDFMQTAPSALSKLAERPPVPIPRTRCAKSREIRQESTYSDATSDGNIYDEVQHQELLQTTVSLTVEDLSPAPHIEVESCNIYGEEGIVDYMIPITERPIHADNDMLSQTDSRVSQAVDNPHAISKSIATGNVSAPVSVPNQDTEVDIDEDNCYANADRFSWFSWTCTSEFVNKEDVNKEDVPILVQPNSSDEIHAPLSTKYNCFDGTATNERVATENVSAPVSVPNQNTEVDIDEDNCYAYADWFSVYLTSECVNKESGSILIQPERSDEIHDPLSTKYNCFDGTATNERVATENVSAPVSVPNQNTEADIDEDNCYANADWFSGTRTSEFVNKDSVPFLVQPKRSDEIYDPLSTKYNCFDGTATNEWIATGSVNTPKSVPNQDTEVDIDENHSYANADWFSVTSTSELVNKESAPSLVQTKRSDEIHEPLSTKYNCIDGTATNERVKKTEQTREIESEKEITNTEVDPSPSSALLSHRREDFQSMQSMENIDRTFHPRSTWNYSKINDSVASVPSQFSVTEQKSDGEQNYENVGSTTTVKTVNLTTILEKENRSTTKGDLIDTGPNETNDERNTCYAEQCHYVRPRRHKLQERHTQDKLREACTSMNTDTTDTDRDKEHRNELEFLSDKTLSKIAQQLGKEWYRVAIHLDLKKAKIEQIQMDHPMDVQTQILNALISWRDSRHSSSTLMSQLLEALTETDRHDIAYWLRQQYQDKMGQTLQKTYLPNKNSSKRKRNDDAADNYDSDQTLPKEKVPVHQPMRHLYAISKIYQLTPYDRVNHHPNEEAVEFEVSQDIFEAFVKRHDKHTIKMYMTSTKTRKKLRICAEI